MVIPMINSLSLKFHHAARIYCLNVVLQYILLTNQNTPFSEIGWIEGLVIAGSFIIFGLLFTYFIFNEGRILTIILIGVFGIQVGISVIQFDQLSPMIQWLALLHLITCYLLSRAAFDL